jgi:hypothetical protein
MHLRLVSIFLAAVTGSFWETAGFAEATRITNDLVGPVRSVIIKKLGYSTTETYDRDGHLIEAVIDVAHANTATYSLFQYDQDGHLQEELTLDPSGRLMFRKRVLYARDSEGRDTASVTTSENGGFQHAEFSLYDQRGHLWEQLWVNHSVTHKSLFDVLGRRIYSARYSKGELFSELKHRYDVQGRLHEIVIYNAQGVQAGRVANDYDEMGRRVRATTETFGKDQPQRWITTYEYDDMGNWIKELTAEQSPSQKTTTSPLPIVQERQIQYYNLAENKAP